MLAIRKLFDLFYRKVQFGPSQIKECLYYIEEAEKLAEDKRVSVRLNELKSYMAYVYLYSAAQDVKNGTLEQRLLPVEKMAWTLYESKIIHSYRIMQLLSYNFLNAQTPDKALSEYYYKLHLKTFPDSDDPDAYWRKDYTYSPTEIANILTNIGATRTLGSEIYSGEIVDQIAASKSNYKPKSKITLEGNFTVRGYFSLFAEKPSNIAISWHLSNSQQDLPSATISGTDKDYNAVYDYPIKGQSGKISISLSKGESYFFIHASPNTTYELKIELNTVYCFFKGSPRGKMNFRDEKNNYTYNPSSYPSHFYIPQNAKEVQYKVQLNSLKIISPNGTQAKTELLKTFPDGGWEIRSFTPPPNQRGKFWKAVINNNYNYEMLNIPDVYFLFEEKN